MESLYSKPVTILGIGNILLRDEGLGVEVVNRLSRAYAFPDRLQLIDGGTLGVLLFHYIIGTEKLMIVDSVSEEAGKIFRYRGNEIKNHFAQKISAHELGLQDILTTLEITGKKIPQIELIGAAPYSLDAGIGLTPEMEKLVPTLMNEVLETLRGWNVPFERKISNAND